MTQAAAALVLPTLVASLAGCRCAPDVRAFTDAEGRARPLVCRHEVALEDGAARQPVAGAMVAVRGAGDPIWQVGWTGPRGAAVVSQEYEEGKVDAARGSRFYELRDDGGVRAWAPGCEVFVHHPGYRHAVRPRGAEERDLAPGEIERARVVLTRAHRVRLEPARRGDDPAAGAKRRPDLADLFELARAELRRRAPPDPSALVPHGGRFSRAPEPAGREERAARLYFRRLDEAYVLIAAAAPGEAARAAIELCDRAEVILFGDPVEPRWKPPHARWVRADRTRAQPVASRLLVAWRTLETTIDAGARRVAAVYPIELAPGLEERLRVAAFEPLAEWWWALER